MENVHPIKATTVIHLHHIMEVQVTTGPSNTEVVSTVIMRRMDHHRHHRVTRDLVDTTITSVPLHTMDILRHLIHRPKQRFRLTHMDILPVEAMVAIMTNTLPTHRTMDALHQDRTMNTTVITITHIIHITNIITATR